MKIFSSIILVIVGVLIGLFVVTSYQFHRRVQNAENMVLQNDQKITAIEDYLNQQTGSTQQPTAQ